MNMYENEHAAALKSRNPRWNPEIRVEIQKSALKSRNREIHVEIQKSTLKSRIHSEIRNPREIQWISKSRTPRRAVNRPLGKHTIETCRHAQSNRNRTFPLRFNFAEVGVFLQNGCLLQHVNHLKENGETPASGLLHQDLTVRNGETVAIDIHCGVLFVTWKGIIRQNSGLAVDLDELLLPHGGAYSALVSGTVDFVWLE